MSIIADKEFRMIKRLLSAELEDIDSCRVGTCNIRFGGQNWYDKYVLYLFSTMLLKTAHTLLLKYDIRNRYRSTVSYTYIRALLITTITYCTCLNALVAEKLGIDRQFAVLILIQPIAPIYLHLIYWQNTYLVYRHRAYCTFSSEPIRQIYRHPSTISHPYHLRTIAYCTYCSQRISQRSRYRSAFHTSILRTTGYCTSFSQHNDQTNKFRSLHIEHIGKINRYRSTISHVSIDDFTCIPIERTMASCINLS